MFYDRHHVLDTHNYNPLFLSVTVIDSDQKASRFQHLDRQSGVVFNN